MNNWWKSNTSIILCMLLAILVVGCWEWNSNIAPTLDHSPSSTIKLEHAKVTQAYVYISPKLRLHFKVMPSVDEEGIITDKPKLDLEYFYSYWKHDAPTWNTYLLDGSMSAEELSEDLNLVYGKTEVVEK